LCRRVAISLCIGGERDSTGTCILVENPCDSTGWATIPPSDLFMPSATFTVSSRECDEGSNRLDHEGIPMISTFEETEEQMVINKS